MKAKNSDFVVGFVITLSIIILIFGIIFLKEYNIGEETQTIYALFDDIGTLSMGDPVKINGVKMGKVEDRYLQGNKVLVTMSVDASVKVPDDSRVTIQNVGLMGERMIGIRLGNSSKYIDNSIPMKGYFDSGIAEAMGMLGDVFVDVKEMVLILRKLLDETIANDEFLVTFNNIKDRLERLTKAVDRMVVGNEQEIDRIIKDVKSATVSLNGFVDENIDDINKIVKNFSITSDKAVSLINKTDDITKKLDLLMEKITSDESTVGKLLKDEELYSRLKSTVIEADSLLKTINKTGKIKVKIGF